MPLTPLTPPGRAKVYFGVITKTPFKESNNFWKASQIKSQLWYPWGAPLNPLKGVLGGGLNEGGGFMSPTPKCIMFLESSCQELFYSAKICLAWLSIMKLSKLG